MELHDSADGVRRRRPSCSRSPTRRPRCSRAQNLITIGAVQRAARARPAPRRRARRLRRPRRSPTRVEPGLTVVAQDADELGRADRRAAVRAPRRRRAARRAASRCRPRLIERGSGELAAMIARRRRGALRPRAPGPDDDARAAIPGGARVQHRAHDRPARAAGRLPRPAVDRPLRRPARRGCSPTTASRSTASCAPTTRRRSRSPRSTTTAAPATASTSAAPSAPGLTPETALAALPSDVEILHVGTLGLMLEPMATALEAVVERLAGQRADRGRPELSARG